MFGYSGLSVNSDLSCMFCFINKISTFMQKKKKKVVEYMGQGVCADYGVFYVLLDLCGDLKPLQVFFFLVIRTFIQETKKQKQLHQNQDKT